MSSPEIPASGWPLGPYPSLGGMESMTLSPTWSPAKPLPHPGTSLDRGMRSGVPLAKEESKGWVFPHTCPT